MPASQEIRLAARPVGLPKATDFEVATATLPDTPAAGEVLVRNLWMSVDPYMRGRMMDVKSYVPPFQIGAPLEGGALGRVEASNNPGYAKGDLVMNMMGWREWFVSNGTGMEKVTPLPGVPEESFLGALGMPGLTAYAGLTRIGEVKDGETVLVSAASGAVGSIVCQLAKARGCRVVGTAGSDEKCAWLEKEAGVDKAINYKTCGPLVKAMSEACPKGVDVYFENVGGAHLEAALHLMNTFGRVALCGMISQYNNAKPEPGPVNLVNAVRASLTIRGFIVFNHQDMRPAFYEEMARLIKAGKMTWRQTTLEGIAKAPEAFMNLFSGDNFGKMLVKLA